MTKQRVLICGDRNWSNFQIIKDKLRVLSLKYEIEYVIEGEAKGADTLGRIAATQLMIQVLRFPAKWGTYGRAAGPIRNQQMLDEGKPTIVLELHNAVGKSKGTADMVLRAKAAGLPV